MKTLANPRDLAEIRGRVAALTSSDTRRWGSMTVDQMICHATDSLLCAVGQRTVALLKKPAIPLPIYRWLALRLPVKWPEGVPTTPEMKQGVGGTPPREFNADRTALLSALDTFMAHPGPWPPHPIFRELTPSQWMRWGYLHTDHHLRQFGR